LRSAGVPLAVPQVFRFCSAGVPVLFRSVPFFYKFQNGTPVQGSFMPAVCAALACVSGTSKYKLSGNKLMY